MTKAELANIICKNTGLAKTKATDAINAVFAGLATAFENGDSYTEQGFGSFSVQEKKERKGRNPRTGEEMTIPASRTVKFSISKTLKDKLNK